MILRDRDDDALAVSASTLLLLTTEFIRMSSTERIRDVIKSLRNNLLVLKYDLTTSIGAIMDVIAKIFEQLGVMDIVLARCSLTELVPRLQPFFRHTNTGVLIAVLNTLLTFLDRKTSFGCFKI
ncbi:unnamed protein product [Mucor hiemalis]